MVLIYLPIGWDSWVWLLMEKSLSVETLIYKEENRIVGVIFGKIEVWFFGLEVAEMLDFSGF